MYSAVSVKQPIPATSGHLKASLRPLPPPPHRRYIEAATLHVVEEMSRQQRNEQQGALVARISDVRSALAAQQARAQRCYRLHVT